VEWSEQQRAHLAAEYQRIGYRPGERWPAPPEELTAEDLLALFARIPDGGGLEGYRAELARMANEGR
jgi:hypothetical protein